jgi:hypothetical protein
MRYRVSFLMAPESMYYVSASAPISDPKIAAYRDASFGMGKSAAEFSKAVSHAASLGLYERVVNLDADDMEDVFAMCNSANEYWGNCLPESANAVFLKNGGLRSMSVGDLIDDGAGNYWVCASCGFEPVSLGGSL